MIMIFRIRNAIIEIPIRLSRITDTKLTNPARLLFGKASIFMLTDQ